MVDDLGSDLGGVGVLPAAEGRHYDATVGNVEIDIGPRQTLTTLQTRFRLLDRDYL